MTGLGYTEIRTEIRETTPEEKPMTNKISNRAKSAREAIATGLRHMHVTIYALVALALAGCAVGADDIAVTYDHGTDEATVSMDGGVTLTVPVENIEGLGSPSVTLRTDGGLHSRCLRNT